MKHISPSDVTAESSVRTPTRRALAKQQTRAKVLAAARRLFSEEGYEGATIRDIAAAAGMSTGAVFANFSDKSDLFREIMVTDMAALADSMREASLRGANAEDSLLKIFMAGYTFYKTQLPLARAAFSVGWSPEDGPALRRAPPVHLLNELMAEALNKGVATGEIQEGADLELRAHMLFETYLSNYPQAIFESWSLEALEARSRDQIRILLAGARKA